MSVGGQDRETHRDKREIGGCLGRGWGLGDRSVIAKCYGFFEAMKMF
jgi:hypothetical protein